MMDPEKNDGNIEYKLKLVNKTNERIEELATQMRYRCNEGNGECIYNIGVEDNGNILGISDDEFNETIEILKSMAIKNNYSVNLLSKTDTKDEKKVYEVLVREKNENKYIDIKVAVAGTVDAGKTSFIGTLSTGQNDNGRGSARSSVFNFIHEVKTGRTSSVAQQILGYDYDGKIVNYSGLSKMSWAEIVEKSSKIISFFDLAGHEKYLKTTITGLASSFPDICCIMISGNNGISPMTKEHIFLCVTLKIPFIIIITKIDLCKERKNVLEETLKDISKFLKYPGIRRIPFNIKNDDDIITSIKNVYNESIIPIFQISNVSGEGLNQIRTFFNILQKKPAITKEIEVVVEYHIDNTFMVAGVGLVVGGNLISGTIKVGDKLLIGPINGQYEQIVIKSIHCKKISLQKVTYGSYVCLAIKKIERNKIKKGSVIISNNHNKLLVNTFIAKIDILRTHTTTVRVGYEPTLHAYSIRQTVKITEIKDKKNIRNTVFEDNILRNGDTALVTFNFKYRPEFLKVGTRFILCEGKCKIIGEVVSN
jgi:GTPase